MRNKTKLILSFLLTIGIGVGAVYLCVWLHPHSHLFPHVAAVYAFGATAFIIGRTIG